MLRLLGWLFGFGVFCALGAVAVAAVYLNKCRPACRTTRC